MTLSLDILANNFSPPAPYLAAPVSETTSSPTKSGKASWKKRRHKLRRTAGNIVGGRVKQCGRKPIGPSIGLMRRCDSGHHFSGLETCGSVWACPVCSVKVTETRKVEIKTVLDGHYATGGIAAMATLTIPHHVFQSPRELRRAVSGAFRKVKSGKPWQKARAKYQWAGDVRALEVTHGRSGWHPHPARIAAL